MTIFLILSIIFFIISISLFGLILYIFYKNKKYKEMETELKKDWNDLSLYNFEKINLPIEHISFLDEKFEKIMYLFNDFSEKYWEKLEIIKNKIYKLQKTLSNYDWKSFNEIYQSAKLEIRMLKSSLSSLFEIQQNILNYKDYISYILVAYRENSWNLIDFYNTNLSDDTKDIDNIKLIKQNVSNLRFATEELNECLENYDINYTISSINNANSAFCKLWESINKMYITRKQSNYIDYSINEINNILKNNYKTIQTNVINSAEKQMSKVIKNYDYVKANADKGNEKELQKLTLSIIKSLWNIKKDLNITFKSSEFFNKNKLEIDSLFKKAAVYIPDLTKVLNKIFDNFIENTEIKTLILDCNTKFFQILGQIKDYQKQINRNNYDPSDLLDKARNIITMIIDNVSEADKIVAEVISKYNSSKKILNDITCNKLLLTQMKSYMLKNKIDDEKNNELIDRLSNELDGIERKLFIEKSSNNEYCVAALAECKSEILTLKEILSKTEVLKKYIVKILNYACLKMTLDTSLNYNLDKTIDLYNDGKFKESALLILNQIKNNKKYK